MNSNNFKPSSKLDFTTTPNITISHFRISWIKSNIPITHKENTTISLSGISISLKEMDKYQKTKLKFSILFVSKLYKAISQNLYALYPMIESSMCSWREGLIKKQEPDSMPEELTMLEMLPILHKPNRSSI